jgi:xylulokinase
MLLNYMGVDVGTSGCKAVIFNENGQQLAAASCEYDVIFSDDGGAELNSDEVIEKCFSVIRGSARQVTPGSVRALGISSQGEAFTAIGADGKALCHAMVSSDIRSERYISQWSQNFDEKKLYQITGHTAHTLFSLFKLLWLKDNRPDVWKNSRQFLCFEDLLQLRLGLDPAISWSLAGRTMIFNVRSHQWSSDILNLLGISSDQLARPLPSGRIAGIITKEISDDLGLATGAFVVCGGHDQPCGALGAGVTKPGMAMYATGTVECITPAINKPIFSEELRRNNLCTYDHAVEGMYATVAFSLTGGNILKWFKNEFAAQERIMAENDNVNIYEYLLKKMPDEPSDLFVLPYFTPSGTPYFDAQTRGTVFGLRLSTGRMEFMRALLEGVALEMRLNLQILEESGYEIKELRVIGGGAKSAKWTQLKADVLGKKMTIIKVTEAGCLGAAMLACAADTGKSLRGLAEEWVKTETEIFPMEVNRKIYDYKFEYYKELYPQVKKLGLPV